MPANPPMNLGPPQPSGQTPRVGLQPCPQVKSADLLQGRKAVDIEHNGLTYRLQMTKLGKLILTK